MEQLRYCIEVVGVIVGIGVFNVYFRCFELNEKQWYTIDVADNISASTM